MEKLVQFTKEFRFILQFFFTELMKFQVGNSKKHSCICEKSFQLQAIDRQDQVEVTEKCTTKYTVVSCFPLERDCSRNKSYICKQIITREHEEHWWVFQTSGIAQRRWKDFMYLCALTHIHTHADFPLKPSISKTQKTL